MESHPGWSAVLPSQLTATSASRVQVILMHSLPVVRITGIHHHTRLTLIFLVEMRFHHVVHVGLKLLASSDPSTWLTQSAGITGVGSHAWLKVYLFI